MLVLDDMELSVKFKARVVEKNGKQYIDFQRAKLSLNPRKIYFYLENLFNGDKTLGDNMNKFINENSEDIFNELKPAIVEAMGAVIISVANGPFGKYAYSEVFQK